MKKKLQQSGPTPMTQILGMSGKQNTTGRPKRNKAKTKLRKQSRKKNRK